MPSLLLDPSPLSTAVVLSLAITVDDTDADTDTDFNTCSPLPPSVAIDCLSASCRPPAHSFHHRHSLPSRKPPGLATGIPPRLPRSLHRLSYSPPQHRAMAMTVDVAPPSPPALSSSSTKSSSLRSSRSYSPENDTSSDISHFEDITLSDSPITSAAQKPCPDQRSRPAFRPAHSSSASPTLNRSFTNLRDLPNGLRTTATLNNHARSQKYDARSPRLPLQRSHTAFTPTSHHNNTGYRTPSPCSTPPLSSSPSSQASSAIFRVHSQDALHLPLSRRTSWQNVPRKTAEEIEKEYQDSDDDLPDDFIVWNVPLSPRPVDSRSPSPEHRQLRPTMKSASSRKSYLATGRASSWSAALSNLTDEVQVLTERLEFHADHQATTPEQSPRPSLQKRSKTCQLPPIQRQNVMVDPLPISKEKEKLLTRTRPSWLPPKSKKEEQKHLREYQKMMAKFDKAEGKKAAQKELIRQSKDLELSLLEKTWTSDILPDFETEATKPRTRELYWRGIPAAIRGDVWARAIGNELQLSAASHAAATERARASQQRHIENGVLAAIYKDILTAFPSLSLFQPNCPLHQALLELLTAHASYCSDSYAAGTASIAALLMLTPPRTGASPAATFITLENLLNRPMLRSFTLADASAKARTHATLLMALADALPSLHAHLTKPALALEPAAFLDRTCASLLTLALADHATAQRVWDVLVFAGDAGLVAGVVAVLRRLESRLYGSRDEVVAALGCKGEACVVSDADEVLRDLKWAMLATRQEGLA